MKNTIKVIVASLSFALAAGATDIPRYETFFGYNFVRFNPNSGFIPSFNANGGSGQFVYNFYKYVGAVVDVGAVTKGVLNGVDADTTVMHFVAGPRFSYHNHSRYTPFAQVMFGGAYATTSAGILGLPVAPPVIGPPITTPVSVRVGASNLGFAMMAGGGLDIKFHKHIAFRPVAADYYLTRMPSFLTTGDTSNRNNWRLSTGVNFMFGAQ